MRYRLFSSECYAPALYAQYTLGTMASRISLLAKKGLEDYLFYGVRPGLLGYLGYIVSSLLISHDI